MPTYHISWEIDLDADTPREAAKFAHSIQRDPSSFAQVFDVVDECGDRYTFDLAEGEDG